MARHFHYPSIHVSRTRHTVFQTAHLIIERIIKPVQMTLFQWIILFSGGDWGGGSSTEVVLQLHY